MGRVRRDGRRPLALRGSSRGHLICSRVRFSVTNLRWRLSIWVGGGGWSTRASRSRWPWEGAARRLTVRAEMPWCRSGDALRPDRKVSERLLAVATEGLRWRPFPPPHPGPGVRGKAGETRVGGRGQATGWIVAGLVASSEADERAAVQRSSGELLVFFRERIAFLGKRLRVFRAARVVSRRLLKPVPRAC